MSPGITAAAGTLLTTPLLSNFSKNFLYCAINLSKVHVKLTILTLFPGQAQATLSHPAGGTCRVLVAGGRVVSWRAQGAGQRLDSSDVSLGGLVPRGLASIPPEAWEIETLRGEALGGDPISFSVFADATDSRPAARVTVSLTPDSLKMSLEISNMSDDEGAEPIPVDCGLRGRCWVYDEDDLPSRDAEGPEALQKRRRRVDGEGVERESSVLETFGLGLEREGYTEAFLVSPPGCFEVGTASVIPLPPGSTLRGSVTLLC